MYALIRQAAAKARERGYRSVHGLGAPYSLPGAVAWWPLPNLPSVSRLSLSGQCEAAPVTRRPVNHEEWRLSYCGAGAMDAR